MNLGGLSRAFGRSDSARKSAAEWCCGNPSALSDMPHCIWHKGSAIGSANRSIDHGRARKSDSRRTIEACPEMMDEVVDRVRRNPDLLRRSQQLLWYVTHRFTSWDRKAAERYLAGSPVRKLHIGCGKNILPNWLNMDYLPLSREALYLDARLPFFFNNDTFDYIFSEHMIEHISYDYGLKMLAECRRVLKPFGKLRISTPDLAFMINLYRPDKSPLQQEYIKWASDVFYNGQPDINEVFVVNYFMRNWGHTFIYDENTLRTAMMTAGFTSIVKCDLQESEDAALCNLENEARLP